MVQALLAPALVLRFLMSSLAVRFHLVSFLLSESLGQFLTLLFTTKNEVKPWFGHMIFIMLYNDGLYSVFPVCRILKEFESELASFISLETPKWRAPRHWCLPSQVGKGFAFSFL